MGVSRCLFREEVRELTRLRVGGSSGMERVMSWRVIRKDHFEVEEGVPFWTVRDVGEEW